MAEREHQGDDGNRRGERADGGGPGAGGGSGGSPLERVLGLITEVHRGEGITALLMTLNVFLLLLAYYFIKPAREAFLLANEGGARYKAYMGAAIAVVSFLVVPAYAALANRVARNRLVVVVTLFFASNLALFFTGAVAGTPPLWFALLFYLWVGVFNMMGVAQFWAFANDVYSEEQGKRLFPLVGVGASAGAWAGSLIASFATRSVGVFGMLMVAAALLVVFAGVIQLVHRREASRPGSAYGGASEDAPGSPGAGEEGGPDSKGAGDDAKGKGRGAFELVFRYRYLTLIALFAVTFTVVNTNGEFMLSQLVEDRAAEVPEDERGEYIGTLYSRFYFGVNFLGILLQAFVVSRLVRYGGLRLAFFVLPVIAFADSLAVAIAPLLTVLWVGKTVENATDYSVNNTVRNMLWLPTTLDMKYKAKQAVDTFFVRLGDVASGLIVFILAGQLALGIRSFALLNLVIVGGWLFLAHLILKEQGRLREQVKAEGAVRR
jgi:AAA family ATP:ADP antiporter